MYDLIIVGAGAAGVFCAYEMVKDGTDKKILIIEKGYPLHKRKCPKTISKVKECKCKSCSIMEGFYGAGGFSDGKYNITNNFGGELFRYIGREEALELMWEVDKINLKMGGQDAKLYSTGNSDLKTEALRHDLHLLDAKVRHLGTDRNLIIADNMFKFIKDKIDIKFETEVLNVEKKDEAFIVETKDESLSCKDLVVATGRTGSKWIGEVCKKFNIKTQNNRVDIGVR